MSLIADGEPNGVTVLGLVLKSCTNCKTLAIRKTKTLLIKAASSPQNCPPARNFGDTVGMSQ